MVFKHATQTGFLANVRDQAFCSHQMPYQALVGHIAQSANGKLSKLHGTDKTIETALADQAFEPFRRRQKISPPLTCSTF